MTRRIAIALLAFLLMMVGACGGDDADDNTSDQPSPAADADVDDGDGTPAGDIDTSGGDDGGSATGEPSGRLEIAGESYDLSLGDMTTAMCVIEDDRVTIQDMQAEDGTWVAAGSSHGMEGATVRGPDGNITWTTGNSEETEGLDYTMEFDDNTFSVEGEWMAPDDPSTIEQGSLVITC